MNYRIQAWKPSTSTPGNLTVCAEDDPEATRFDVPYFVHQRGWSSEVTVDSLYLAEQILSAMRSAHTSGKKEAFAELRTLIGVRS